MATCLALAGAAMAAHAQPPDTLAQAFEQAWATQPLPQALSARRSALAASRQAADAWTAQPAALELRTKTDRPGTDRGAQELEVGVALPLWLPGQRSRSQALVTQEEQALDARLDSARLQLAGQVREAWWAWQRARAELALAGAQVEHAQALSQDVHRRVRAGDLAPADAHQADGALALAQSAQARAEGQSVQAWQALQGLLGSAQPWPSAAPSTPGPTGAEPTPGEVSADLAQHPLVRDLDQQAATARQAAELADTQSRANPELLLGTVHSRDQRGEPRQRQLTVGLRLPWGESPAQRALAARAHADATELSVQAARQHQQAQATLDGAQARWRAAQRAHEAAQRRATLAHETQAFFDKSFRLGETDLPTRLRIAQEAQEAARQASLAAIDLAAAASAWRQAAGLLPQ
ncbi:MAG: hypothetical protein A2711_04625 [Burkholderiales bacterium RIFCSPHIGHO2_01_FULL_63_240]|nr:MAG: hypothetical protein A2711_04625 [Burkholderiales bacterium RIFCSPHIGHO2_01_FULL_63_240]